MERLVGFGAVLAFACLSHTSAQHLSGTVVVDDGRVGVGLITGGNFGPKSFSIVGSPDGRPKTQEYVNEDKGDVQDIVLQSSTNHKEQQENYQPPRSVSEESDNSEGFNNGNTQLYPVKTLTNTNTGRRGDGNKKGSEAGQIIIGAVVLNSNKPIRDSKKRNDNKNTGNTNAGYEAPESKSNHAKKHGAGNAGVSGQTNSGYNSDSYDERWIWNR